MVKVKDILPLVQNNDVLLMKDKMEEICLLRGDFVDGSLSDKLLNRAVTEIENDENIVNTIVIYTTDEEDYSYSDYYHVSYRLCMPVFAD